MIHFELIFVCGVRHGSKDLGVLFCFELYIMVDIFAYEYSIFPVPLFENTILSPLSYFCNFVKYQLLIHV